MKDGIGTNRDNAILVLTTKGIQTRTFDIYFISLRHITDVFALSLTNCTLGSTEKDISTDFNSIKKTNIRIVPVNRVFHAFDTSNVVGTNADNVDSHIKAFHKGILGLKI